MDIVERFNADEERDRLKAEIERLQAENEGLRAELKRKEQLAEHLKARIALLETIASGQITA